MGSKYISARAAKIRRMLPTPTGRKSRHWLATDKKATVRPLILSATRYYLLIEKFFNRNEPEVASQEMLQLDWRLHTNGFLLAVTAELTFHCRFDKEREGQPVIRG